RPRLDAALEQPVHEPVVEVEAARLRRPVPVRLHARPRDREPVRVDAEPCEQVEIFAPAVVVVARHIAAVAFDDAAVLPERAPDGRRGAVDGRGALDLVRGGGDTPHELRGEAPGTRSTVHPLTAPSMMPAISCRPATKNSTSSGTVAIAVPARTSE